MSAARHAPRVQDGVNTESGDMLSIKQHAMGQNNSCPSFGSYVEFCSAAILADALGRRDRDRRPSPGSGVSERTAKKMEEIACLRRAPMSRCYGSVRYNTALQENSRQENKFRKFRMLCFDWDTFFLCLRHNVTGKVYCLSCAKIGRILHRRWSSIVLLIWARRASLS